MRERVITATYQSAHLRTLLRQARLKLHALQHPPLLPKGVQQKKAVTPQGIEAQRGRVSEPESEVRDAEEKLQALKESLEELEKGFGH